MWSERACTKPKRLAYEFLPSVIAISAWWSTQDRCCLRFSHRLGNARFDTLDILSTETRGSSLVLGSREPRTNRTL